MDNSKKYGADIPRRAIVSQHTFTEKTIQDAIRAVELLPADTRLTSAVMHLQKAFNFVADFEDDNLENNK